MSHAHDRTVSSTCVSLKFSMFGSILAKIMNHECKFCCKLHCFDYNESFAFKMLARSIGMLA